ncbi:MAG: RelA/SpoT family protein [Parcubacteria group bacterium]|jgi:GTP pyrophosphokinase
MNNKEITIEDILKNLKTTHTSQREALIRNAYLMAEAAHQGQKRKSGEPYIQHALHTALNIAKMGMRSKTIAAGLLHDVPEDTSVTLETIEEKFGKEIAFMVDGVTKLGKIRLRGTKEELYLENLRKMFFAMASDIRVVIIKLADRMHNMETLSALPPEKQQRIALETMEVFAPIANRLGIGEIKGRLEDLAFKHLDLQNYELITKLQKEEYEQSKQYLDKAVWELNQDLLKGNIKVEKIFGRTKHPYRLFQKMKKHDMNIEKIYDLIGIRIIVPNISSCYETLGIVHNKYRPLVGRIKDYISLPKPNGYQSIHTTIFGPEGKIIEVQIRTSQMDAEAEFGIAAHWVYSEQHRRSLKNFFFRKKEAVIPEKELAWVKQLREWQNELGKDNSEFMEGLKIEFFKNHIFAFTPMGEVIELPEDATPIDFAYKVHSEIGNRATGAKADGKMVTLDYKIKNGQVIEIMTSRDHKKPSRDWARFVRTSLAKSNIERAHRIEIK